MQYLDQFYLDKEKDIRIRLYKSAEDEITYCIETPHHNTGNLITNLAKLCKLEISRNEHGKKIILGTILASLNGENQEVYILRLGGIKIANIYKDGVIEVKAKIPAINKTLMSQTKDYRLGIEKTIIKSYLQKRLKLRTDLHTHIHANLNSDTLIALGIHHQIKYPLYYVKKLKLELTEIQEREICKQREKVAEKYKDCGLEGKKLTRKIDDETYFNFADLILNNERNRDENIDKIRNSLVLIKDGQAVFTNLEKLYLYRYVFSKGVESENKIQLDLDKINKIENKDIRENLKKMLQDAKSMQYKNNTLLQDKLLWVAREYKKQGIEYAEIAVTWLVRKGEEGAEILQQLHEILPKIELETKVKLRFLGALSRTLMTAEQISEGVEVLKIAAKSPYVVGSDIMGEEINDIRIFQPIIKELVNYAQTEDNNFTIRIHAGENDALRENVQRAVTCVKESVKKGEKFPKCRIGHGLYGIDLETEEGKQLVKELRNLGIVLEFQLTSNIRLNNLNNIENHPMKKYLENQVQCVQGTDGSGFYGTDAFEEQMALQNLLGITDQDILKMKETEKRIRQDEEKSFKQKEEKFQKWLNGRDIKQAVLQAEDENIEKAEFKRFNIFDDDMLESKDVLKEKIKQLPINKVPIIIAGGSFNSKGRETVINEKEKNIIRELVTNLNEEKAYFVVGHKMQGYEKAILDISKELHKKFEVDAIIPKRLSEKEKDNLLSELIDGVCISNESEELGIYKSFNYEIFERRDSILVAFDGNSPVSNLVQEAKNGKGKSKIFVNENVSALQEKARSLEGYVVPFKEDGSIIGKILETYPELEGKSNIYNINKI